MRGNKGPGSATSRPAGKNPNCFSSVSVHEPRRPRDVRSSAILVGMTGSSSWERMRSDSAHTNMTVLTPVLSGSRASVHGCFTSRYLFTRFTAFNTSVRPWSRRMPRTEP